MPPMRQTADVLIVGAGAAGLATAIFAARHAPALHIAALNGPHRIGAKILASGGGRCNVTNAHVTAADYSGGSRNTIRKVLAAFDEGSTREFFADIGVPLHEEESGKLFPDSSSAKTVVAALLREVERLNVPIHGGRRVTSVARDADGFNVAIRTPAGDTQARCQRLVLATGGLSLPKTGSDGAGYSLAGALGHTLIPTTPALDALVLSGGFHRGLAGVSHDAQLTLHTADQKPVRTSGPMLWTHFGLSGPAVLDISRFWNRAQLAGAKPRLTANFVGGAEFAEIEQTLIESAQAQPKSHVSSVLRRWLPNRVGDALARELHVGPQLELGQLSRHQRRQIVHALTAWPVPVVETRGYEHAEVTAGGVPLSEVDPQTMQSRRCPGLYLVGEILDVDGRIGGFNFQWAWSSGFVAGRAVGKP